jgi:mRNA interferase RelE/StbE
VGKQQSRSYQVILSSKAEKELDHLDPDLQARITRKLLLLSSNPRPSGAKKLQGSDNEYRIRIGDYRAIYTIEDKIILVTITRVAHRRDIYEH